MATSSDKGPTYTSIERKINESLHPSFLEIINESHLHAHHAPMRGNTNPETHFRVTVVSEEFAGKPLMKRHRMIYDLLAPELEAGLHALSLRTKTQAEMEKASS